MISGNDREEWLNRITEPGPRLEPDYDSLKDEEGVNVVEVDVSRFEPRVFKRIVASGEPMASTCCRARLVFVHSHYQCERCGRVEHGCCDGAPTDGNQ